MLELCVIGQEWRLTLIKNNGNCVAAVYNDNLRNKILKEHMYKEELPSSHRK